MEARYDYRTRKIGADIYRTHRDDHRAYRTLLTILGYWTKENSDDYRTKKSYEPLRMWQGKIA